MDPMLMSVLPHVTLVPDNPCMWNDAFWNSSLYDMQDEEEKTSSKASKAAQKRARKKAAAKPKQAADAAVVAAAAPQPLTAAPAAPLSAGVSQRQPHSGALGNAQNQASDPSISGTAAAMQQLDLDTSERMADSSPSAAPSGQQAADDWMICPLTKVGGRPLKHTRSSLSWGFPARSCCK
jgi:hypothetical protein